MGRKPCRVKEGLSRGPWTLQEDLRLRNYIRIHGEGQWSSLPCKAGLQRCGKSCRLRWMNYLRPNVKRGDISADEEDLIIRLHRLLGNRWSLIAGRIPGRTDNEIKNYWNTHLRKKLMAQTRANRLQIPSTGMNMQKSHSSRQIIKEDELENAAEVTLCLSPAAEPMGSSSQENTGYDMERCVEARLDYCWNGRFEWMYMYPYFTHEMLDAVMGTKHGCQEAEEDFVDDKLFFFTDSSPLPNITSVP